MELPWDEGPRNAEAHLKFHSQMGRINSYEEALTHLARSGSVFACNCSRAQIKTFTEVEGYPGICVEKKLPLDSPDTAWRLKVENTPSIEMHIAGGHMTKIDLPPDKYYLQVRKKDGAPSYHLASLVDDIHFKTDLIVRGNDLLDSSLAQLYLSGFLPPNQFQAVHFIHHPLILSSEGNKLSKSAGDTSIHALRKSGKTNRDVLNLLGNILSADREFERWEQLGEWMADHWIHR
jgi:glutamyl-tRNA synthetase